MDEIKTVIDTRDVDLGQKKWYAVHTKSRHEKIACQLIQKKNIEAYLPVKKIKKKWSDRIKEIEFPLFKGYLFVRISLSEQTKALQTKGVVRILGQHSPEPIPQEQIESLKMFENKVIEVDPFLHLKPGNSIKIKRGPLKGCIGVLARKKGKYRFIVNVKVIMQSASVEIDANDIDLD